jgi:subtilisin family serine protease
MKLARHVVLTLLACLALLCLGSTGAASAGASTYILIAADENALPAGLAEQVAARGGSILVVGPTVDGWSLDFGTSMAAPHVAGVAALLIGANGGQMNPDAVEAVLRASADDLGKPGVDDFYGNGRVNAARAVGAP